MLVEENSFELVGYISAVDQGATFVVPLFTGRSSNMLVVQEIGVEGLVTGFREVEPRNFTQLDGAGQRISQSQPALWGFRDTDGQALVAEREVLQGFLSARLETLDPPFLKLQVAQFCEDLDELIDAWRSAFQHLEERSPRSARAWRDVVVIPTQMRLAVEHAILAHGLDASVEQLSRTVDVDVDEGELQLHLSPRLHIALMSNLAARRSLERSAAPIRRAFSLPAGPVTLIAKDAASQTNVQPDAFDNVAIAGFGHMAMSLIEQLAPRIEQSSDGRYSHSYGAPRGRKKMVLLQRDELNGAVDWGAPGPPPKLDARNRVLLVTFQLGAGQADLLAQAMAFATQHRDKRRTVIAVIPHLPQEFDEDGQLARSVIPELNRSFDAVWALSDRSPSTRLPLPFGPERSVQASATHFRYLMRLAGQEDLRHHLVADYLKPEMVNVVGSASGDRTITNLTEHAMMRLAHHLFDIKTVTSARLISDGQELALEAVVREIIHRDAPLAKVSLVTHPKGDGGPHSITIALKNVAVLDAGPRELERYCAEQLERFGWDIDQFEPNGLLHVTYREFENVPTDCKYIAAGFLDAALRTRQRRRQNCDEILLTNASVRRRSFALHVLNGAVPVHCSRIEALHHIYRRRYAYAFTYLQQDRKTGERILVPAALDWLNLHHWLDTKKLGKARLTDSRAIVEFAPRSVALWLPLEFTRGRGNKASVVLGEAGITFDDSGWRLDHVSVDGTHLGST